MRRRIVSLVLGSAAALGGALSPAPLSAAGNVVVLQNFTGNKCLQPINGSTAQGAAIVQEPCSKASAAQQWAQVPVGNNNFHYVNSVSGLCLDARGGAANHTPVQQWTCNNISNENWQPGADEDDDIPPLFSRVSGTMDYCLDVPGGQTTTAGLAMQIYRCNGTISQIWQIYPPGFEARRRHERNLK